MKLYIFLTVAVLVLMILTNACSFNDNSYDNSYDSIELEALAQDKCIELCKAQENNVNLSASPCLSNNIVKDWVCDVAHSPRQDIDNLPENQCSAFRNNIAHHFVELDENCNLIKIH